MQKRGYHDFSFSSFCLTVPKISVGNSSVYQKISGIEKFYASERERGVSRFSVENSLSHSTEKFRWGTLRCIRKFRVTKNFMQKKGISLNSVEKFLSHSADKTRRRTLLCFDRILVLKSFSKGRGRFTTLSKIFLSHSAEKLRKGTLYCFTNFGFQKILKTNRKNIWHDRDSNSKPTSWERCCRNPTAVIHFWIKTVGNFGLIKKKKNDLTEWIIFLAYYICFEK